MVLDDVSHRHHPKFVDSFTSYAIAITFLVAVSFLVIGLFRKCRECCAKYFKRRRKPKPSKIAIPNKYELLRKKRPSTLTPSHRLSSVSIGNIDSFRNAEFEIPGMVSCESVQPTDSSSASGSGSLGGSEEYYNSRFSIVDDKFLEEYIQPETSEALYPIKGPNNKMYRKSPKEKRRSTTLFEAGLEGQLMPELYEACDRKTQGSSSLGKVMFTLQYEDNSKKKLLLFLHHLSNLKFTKLHENVEQLILAITLLPEREYIYKTKELERSQNIKLSDSFTFHSRPRNRDFESRTVVITIIYICPHTGKESVYGEARLPLLGHEIYSQVVTDVSVGVTTVSQNEIGDAQIQISYSSTRQELSILLKTVHFSNISLLDKLSGIHVKSYLASTNGDKLSKKKVISKSIRTNDSVFVEFQEPISFKLTSESYSRCTLKMSIHGKHKIMVKHLSLGKMRIGENSVGECGRVHWKTVLASQEIAWTMWHPIYSG